MNSHTTQLLTDLLLCTFSSAAVLTWLLGREVDAESMKSRRGDSIRRPAGWLPRECYTEKGRSIFKWRMLLLILSGAIMTLFILQEYLPKVVRPGM